MCFRLSGLISVKSDREIGSILVSLTAIVRDRAIEPGWEHAMRLIAWRDEYNIGIAAIDDEHRHLIDTINRLHEELDGEGKKRTVVAFFEELQNEIAAHFTHEEVLMRENSYEELGRHKGDHDRLLEELGDIKEAYAYSDEVDSVELGIRLEEWFFRHFRTYDAKLHQVLGEF